MLTSSIDRRGSCSRSNGASATSSRPAARSSSSSARSVTPSPAASDFEIGERERGDRPSPAPAPSPPAPGRRPRRGSPARRRSGLHPPPAGIAIGAPGSAATSATRTKVVFDAVPLAAHFVGQHAEADDVVRGREAGELLLRDRHPIELTTASGRRTSRGRPRWSGRAPTRGRRRLSRAWYADSPAPAGRRPPWRQASRRPTGRTPESQSA